MGIVKWFEDNIYGLLVGVSLGAAVNAFEHDRMFLTVWYGTFATLGIIFGIRKWYHKETKK